MRQEGGGAKGGVCLGQGHLLYQLLKGEITSKSSSFPSSKAGHLQSPTERCSLEVAPQTSKKKEVALKKGFKDPAF